MKREVTQANIFEEPADLGAGYHQCLAAGTKLPPAFPEPLCEERKGKPSAAERLLNSAKRLDTRSQG